MPGEKPTTDPEIQELAAGIAGEFFEPVEKGDEVAPGGKPEDASKEDKPGEKPKADTSEEKPKEPPPGDKPKEGDQEGDEDPLKGIDFTKPKEVLSKLLEHPQVGPALQSWSDSAAAAQVQAALNEERPTIEASERQRAEESRWDEHFSGMSEEDIAEEIAKDKKAAVAYANYQARMESGTSGLNPEAVAKASQVFAYTVQVAQNSKLLEESDLPDDTKKELAHSNFLNLGPDGIVAWGEAIMEAVIVHRVEPRAQELLEEKWETYKQEHLAEVDGERPPVVDGIKTAPLPDLLGTDSGDMLERALSKEKK